MWSKEVIRARYNLWDKMSLQDRLLINDVSSAVMMHTLTLEQLDSLGFSDYLLGEFMDLKILTNRRLYVQD